MCNGDTLHCDSKLSSSRRLTLLHGCSHLHVQIRFCLRAAWENLGFQGQSVPLLDMVVGQQRGTAGNQWLHAWLLKP